MNEFSSFERSLYSQSVTLTTQPFEQNSFSSSPTDSLSGNVLPLVAMGFCIAIAFFRIGVGFGKRSQRRYDLIQTLERIWQLSAHRND
jgi:nucleoside recognition membrane protein YjiH